MIDETIIPPPVSHEPATMRTGAVERALGGWPQRIDGDEHRMTYAIGYGPAWLSDTRGGWLWRAAPGSGRFFAPAPEEEW